VRNDDGSPGLSVKKRKRTNNTPPIRGSGTFALSPLANSGLSTNTSTASTFKTLTGIRNASPAAPIAYATTSIIMSANNNAQANTPATNTASAITVAPVAPSTPTPTSNSAAQDVEMADAASVPAIQAESSVRAEQVSIQGFADIDMDEDVKPQRPAADVDAAEMLLGLRRPS
jgi:hypothetical protein